MDIKMAFRQMRRGENRPIRRLLEGAELRVECQTGTYKGTASLSLANGERMSCRFEASHAEGVRLEGDSALAELYRRGWVDKHELRRLAARSSTR